MKMRGKSLRSFSAFDISGEAIVTSQPITLLGFVDPVTGQIVQKDHQLFGQSITGKIFVFPKGIGSTVGPYTLINLVKNGKGPLAIINRESDQGTISGCSIARIPMVYNLNEDPIETIKTGDNVRIISENSLASIEIVR